MKWLILLVLISCGKHEEPTARDIQDSDGDQILNYEESDFDKYIAQYDSLGSIRGKIRFTDGQNFEIPFSNDLDLRKNSFDLMVLKERKIRKEDYFTEWSKLRIESSDLTKLTREEFQVYLQFETASDGVDEIVLIEKDKSSSLGKWLSELRLSLSRDRLKDLIEGRSFIFLKKNFKKSPLFNTASEETIRNSTYRVHYYDGTSSKILYVAKKLSFREFQEHLGIKATEMSADNFFFHTSISLQNQWFSRELSSGDKVLIYTDFETLKETFKNKHHYQKKIVLRENGIPKTSLHLNNKHGAAVYLRIKEFYRTKRDFAESTTERWFGGGGGKEEGSTRYRCGANFRNITNETTILPELSELFENLQERPAISFQEVQENMGEEGIFWEMKLNSEETNIILTLNQLPSSTYTVTGEFSTNCREGKPAPSYSTNTEGKMAFEVESYVEKMEE